MCSAALVCEWLCFNGRSSAACCNAAADAAAAVLRAVGRPFYCVVELQQFNEWFFSLLTYLRVCCRAACAARVTRLNIAHTSLLA
jgi:hypothetical protein